MAVSLSMEDSSIVVCAGGLSRRISMDSGLFDGGFFSLGFGSGLRLDAGLRSVGVDLRSGSFFVDD